MTIYLVTEDDADPYCGYYVKSAWSSEELAKKEIARLTEINNRWPDSYNIQEVTIDEKGN